jgi:hypothetical protein
MSGAPYESFSTLGNIAERVAGGNQVELEQWLGQWGEWSDAVREVAKPVREGVALIHQGNVEDALWHLTVLSWPRATDDLSRALADFGLRQASIAVQDDSPETGAALLWLTHRPTRPDERDMLTLLVEASLSPREAYGEYVKSVLEAIDGQPGEQLETEERARVRAMFEAKHAEAIAPKMPAAPITSASPKPAATEGLSAKKIVLGVVMLIALIAMAFGSGI